MIRTTCDVLRNLSSPPLRREYERPRALAPYRPDIMAFACKSGFVDLQKTDQINAMQASSRSFVVGKESTGAVAAVVGGVFGGVARERLSVRKKPGKGVGRAIPFRRDHGLLIYDWHRRRDENGIAPRRRALQCSRKVQPDRHRRNSGA